MTESNIRRLWCVSEHATEYRPSRMHKLVADSATSIVFQVWLCILVLLLATTIAVVFSSNLIIVIIGIIVGQQYHPHYCYHWYHRQHSSIIFDKGKHRDHLDAASNGLTI